MFHFVAQSQKVGIAKADGFWSDGAEGPAFAVALARQLHSPLDLHPSREKGAVRVWRPGFRRRSSRTHMDSGFFWLNAARTDLL